MKIKYFLSILLAVCMALEICLIPVSAWTITTESVENKSDIESQVDLSASLRSNNLVSGKDYIENEIIVCSKIDELESEITKYEDEYNLTLDFCFSNDTDSDDEKTATYLMSTTKTSADIIDIIEDMQKNESIVFAQPNYIYSYEDTEDSKVSIANENQLKNYANSQEDMFLTLFNKSSNWMANGGSNILIAVIDSGIDLKHPTLINSLWSNDGIYGYNFTEPSNIKPILLDNGDEYKKEHYEHGTAVAGIIGMQINSADGYACRGIAPGAKIIDLQISDNNTKPTTLAVIAALKKAEELGAKIANMSFATTNYDMALNLACNRAARNMVLSAAAGNEKTNERMFYPAAFSSVIGVMAYGGSDKDIVITDDASKSYISRNYPKSTQIIYDYSNYDARLVYYDVIAPGVNICSAKNGNTGNISGYWFYSGTSMASPIVTAAAAIYWQKNYNATVAQITYRLCN